ncbi:MAG: Crp/Fnr family transcriptional regulator [Spirochaetes bacterium]|nr:Crp/Fnr family transcriptional regulator [Spirochaetota bacterium]MBU1079886.1 Crp/Fnr family transcriptional regulator [Spirochaetota bacterium]
MAGDSDASIIFTDAAAAAGVRLRERSFQKGERLFDAGVALGGVHLVRSGLVASRALLENGREVLIGIHGKGDTLGDLEYCMGGSAICGVSALEASSTLWADERSLDRMVAADSRLPLAFARVLAVRLYRSSRRLSEGIAYPLEYSLLKAVFARLDAPDDGRPLSKRDLAEYLGHTERHVNRLLRSLEEAGALSVRDGSVAIGDEAIARRRMERLEE